jgi:hypothetical protein
VLHHHEGGAVGHRTDVDDPRHVLALDLDGHARLALEARHGVRVAEDFIAQELDGDPLVELQVPGLDDDAHSAGREHALDAIFAAEHVAGVDSRRVASRRRTRRAFDWRPSGVTENSRLVGAHARAKMAKVIPTKTRHVQFACRAWSKPIRAVFAGYRNRRVPTSGWHAGLRFDERPRRGRTRRKWRTPCMTARQ